MSIDNIVYNWVQANLQQPMLQLAARDITSLGGDTLVALFTVFTTGVLWKTVSGNSACRFAMTMLLTAGMIVGLKLLIGRPCPMQPDPFQHMGDFPAGLLSIHLPCMPSGHTAGSTVLYGLILFTIRDAKPWIGPRLRQWATGWLLALPIAIGITRIVLSAHWLTDVLTGYVLGWTIVLLSQKAQHVFSMRS